MLKTVLRLSQILVILSLIFAVGCGGSEDNQPPTCSITNPQNNAKFTTTETISVTVAAQDSDGTIAEVQLYVDNVGHSSTTTFPYNFTINAGELSQGTHTLKAVAKDNKGAIGESSINIVVEQASTESPDFVTFSDGQIPNTWQTPMWYVDNTFGYDDLYSLAGNSGSVMTSKTCSFVEFYLTGYGDVNFYINNLKVKVCALTNNWVKHSFYVGEGYHTFKWEFANGSLVHLDAIRFKNETPLEVGMYYQGGIIAYLDNTKQNGLIAATSDQSAGTEWYNGSYIATGATGTAMYLGNFNTYKIVDAQGNGAYAAKLCDDLVLNVYDDWFLPSKDELNELYKNRNLIGGFSNNANYWSSSQPDSFAAWFQNFATGKQDLDYTSRNSFRVRAVRYF